MHSGKAVCERLLRESKGSGTEIKLLLHLVLLSP
jgi:hypothetical protein